MAGSGGFWSCGLWPSRAWTLLAVRFSCVRVWQASLKEGWGTFPGASDSLTRLKAVGPCGCRKHEPGRLLCAQGA